MRKIHEFDTLNDNEKTLALNFFAPLSPWKTERIYKDEEKYFTTGVGVLYVEKQMRMHYKDYSIQPLSELQVGFLTSRCAGQYRDTTIEKMIAASKYVHKEREYAEVKFFSFNPYEIKRQEEKRAQEIIAQQKKEQEQLELAAKEQERLAKLKADEELINKILIEQWTRIAAQKKRDYEIKQAFTTMKDNEPQGYYMSNGKPYATLKEVPQGQLATYVPVLVGGFKGKRKGGKKKGKKFKGKRPKMPKDCSPGNVYESSALMVTDATGALNIVIALNNPQQIFSGVTATGAQDLANNWDAYSVERVSMSTQIRAPITARQGEWNLICDHDSSPPVTAITQNLLLTYTNKRSYSSQASPRWSVVPRKLSQCEYISGIGADPEPAVIVQKGKYDWNTPPSNGFMYVKLIGGPASTNIGTIYVRVHVTAWYKRRLAVTMPRIANVPLLEEDESSESEEKSTKKSKKKV